MNRYYLHFGHNLKLTLSKLSFEFCFMALYLLLPGLVVILLIDWWCQALASMPLSRPGSIIILSDFYIYMDKPAKPLSFSLLSSLSQMFIECFISFTIIHGRVRMIFKKCLPLSRNFILHDIDNQYKYTRKYIIALFGANVMKATRYSDRE